MIKSLSLVASIVSGMGAGVMSAPIMQLDGTSTTQTQYPYTYNITPDYKQQAYSWRDIRDINDPYREEQYGVEKLVGEQRTNQGEIKATTYQNTNVGRLRYVNDEEYRYSLIMNVKPDEDLSYDKNTTLSVLTINPYDEWTTSTLDLTWTTSIQYKIIPQYINANDNYDVFIEYVTYYLITTDDMAAKYSDAYITNQQQNQNWYWDVKNNASGVYEPNYEYTNGCFAQVRNGVANWLTPTLTITKSIPINNNKTNYVLMFMNKRLIFKDPQGNEMTGQDGYGIYVDGWGTQINDIKLWMPERNFTFTMSGNFIPGTHTEVIDLPGIMFQVLGMPFTFITTAFNLTLFPGTPYAIDIGNIFLGFLAIGFIGFIVYTILKKMGKL